MMLTVYSLILPFIVPFINIFLLFGLILGADLSAFYLYRSASAKRENPFFMLLRFFIFYLVFALLVYKVLSGEILRRIYAPVTPGSLAVLFSCAAGWGLTLFFAKALVYREKLIVLFAPFDKKELSAKTRQYSYELQEMKMYTGKIRLFPLVFTVASLILLPFLSFFTGRIFTYQVILFLFLLVFCLSFIFQTRGMDEELLLLSEGIRLRDEWQSLRVRRFFLLILLLSVPAFILSRSSLGLPFSLLQDFYAWLQEITTWKRPVSSAPMPEFPVLERGGPPANQPLMMLGDAAPGTPLFSDELKALFKKILMGMGTGAFVLFLLYPFMTRNGRSRGKGLIKQSLADLGAYLSRLADLIFRRPSGRQKASFRPSGKVRRRKRAKEKKDRKTEEPVHDLPSAGKVIRTFNRLCRWGQKRGQEYRIGISPSDYIKRLAGIIPDRKNDLAHMARFLDDYFYSTRIVDTDEIDDYIRLTGRILKEERKRK